MNISFTGCGFSGIYHLGVVQCMRKHAPALVDGFNVVAGASAGALAGAMLSTGMAVENIVKTILVSTNAAKSMLLNNFSPWFDLMGDLESNLELYLPPDAHKLATRRLSVSLSSMSTRKNFLAEKFSTRRELINALCASCFIPLWGGCTKLYEYRGKYYLDGGFTDNTPQSYPGETITVSPFAGESDICPPSSPSGLDLGIFIRNTPFDFTMSNLLRVKDSLCLPDTLKLVELMREGYNNCLSFLQRRGLNEYKGLGDGIAMHWKDVIPQHLHYLVCVDNTTNITTLTVNAGDPSKTVLQQEASCDSGFCSENCSRANSCSPGSYSTTFSAEEQNAVICRLRSYTSSSCPSGIAGSPSDENCSCACRRTLSGMQEDVAEFNYDSDSVSISASVSEITGFSTPVEDSVVEETQSQSAKSADFLVVRKAVEAARTTTSLFYRCAGLTSHAVASAFTLMAKPMQLLPFSSRQ